jgi:hypothetical protein
MEVDMQELKKAARDLANARARLADAMSFAADSAVAAHAEGMTEVDLAQYRGVNRMTIRKWLVSSETSPGRHVNG